ncbi:Alkaline phosphatase synthesis sensor protein PhoR [Nocardioides aquaticus]|uniref:histidine kinase n=1 Tax=Nocardioides aquaticus TaxID=160826 RepID=A0ABX8EIS2_9ACTN|nr:ATP-binding protein [Nocardioides aquaticus]QVT80413.1 Alkaline phosphatase synthesis sensor protein PhoR [Nocardioides aquaticus]
MDDVALDRPFPLARPFTFDDPTPTVLDAGRLRALRNTGLLALGRHPALDAITRLAARATDSPTALVSLIDAERQVFPSRHGWTDDLADVTRETPLALSFCKYVVANDAPLVVEDARVHPTLATSPGTLEGGAVAYAGVPLHDPCGHVLGALCVTDVVPRQWSEQHLEGLRDLATAAETKIALRLSTREIELDRERLMHVLDGAANTMVVIAAADGVITTMNEQAAELLGHEASAFVGSATLLDLAALADPTVPKAARGEAQDWTVATADDGPRVVSVRTSTLLDGVGDVEGYVVIGDDVSAHRQAEQVLRDTVSRQAEAVRRLEALEVARNDFIATASHELRTPVTSINGFTELLAEGIVGELTPPQRDLVARIGRNSRRLLHLIEDLLNLTRLDATVPDVRTDVAVGPLALRAWESIQPELAARDLETALEVSAGDVVVQGDPVQLERALLNLLTNAVKFTPDGGAVALSVLPHEAGVMFEVADTGRGIAADEQAHVYEPFFRTRDTHEKAVPGSGVGLTVVKRVVDAHGGQVLLDSEVGRGTTVRVVLPVD